MSFTCQAPDIALNLSIKYHEKISVNSFYVGDYNEYIQITLPSHQKAKEMQKQFVDDLKIKNYLKSDIIVQDRILYVHKDYLNNLILFAQKPAPATQQSYIPSPKQTNEKTPLLDAKQTLANKAAKLHKKLQNERKSAKDWKGHLGILGCFFNNKISRKTDKIETLKWIHKCLTSSSDDSLASPTKQLYKNSKRGIFSQRTANIVKKFEKHYPEKRLSLK